MGGRAVQSKEWVDEGAGGPWQQNLKVAKMHIGRDGGDYSPYRVVRLLRPRGVLFTKD